MKESTRAIRFHETGGADRLQIEAVEVSPPAKDEIQIEVKAIGLNRAEIMFREGQYLEAPRFPARLGYEASGVITAVGSDVTAFARGDKVSTIPAFSMNDYGVYGELVNVPANAVAKYPDSLSPEEGTSIWMQYITAYGALMEVGRLKAGQTLVVTAASSSVGVAALQIGAMIGSRTIAVTRTDHKVPFLEKQGTDAVVVTGGTSSQQALVEHFGDTGFDLAFDPIGGEMLPALSAVAQTGGQIIEYGALASAPTPYPLLDALAKGLTIRGFTLFEITHHSDRLERAVAFINDGMASGKLKPVLDKTFAFDEIRKAHEYMESNQQRGKIVVRV